MMDLLSQLTPLAFLLTVALIAVLAEQVISAAHGGSQFKRPIRRLNLVTNGLLIAFGVIAVLYFAALLRVL